MLSMLKWLPLLVGLSVIGCSAFAEPLLPTDAQRAVLPMVVRDYDPLAPTWTPQPVVSTSTKTPTTPPTVTSTPTITPTATPTVTSTPPITYGVVVFPQWSSADDVQLAQVRTLGAKVIRVGFSWRLLEPVRGQYDYNWYIPQVQSFLSKAQANNLQVVAMFAEVPAWANANSWCPVGSETSYASALSAFRQRAVAPYSSLIRAYEVWNEPNYVNGSGVAPFWCNSPIPSPGQYAALLQPAYAALKAVDPQATVLGGSLAGTDTAYLSGLYAAGAASSYDGLAVHPYTYGNTSSPTDCSHPSWAYNCASGGVPGLRNLMLANGDQKPIYFTELGFDNDVGDSLQAQYLTQAFQIAAGWSYVQLVAWYDLDDRYDPSGGHFGLLDSSGTLRPAANAYRQVASP